MVSSLIIDGIVKLINIRKDSNKPLAVCRIYSLQSQLPERVLVEESVGSGQFYDHVSGKRFKTNGEIVVAL